MLTTALRWLKSPLPPRRFLSSKNSDPMLAEIKLSSCYHKSVSRAVSRLAGLGRNVVFCGLAAALILPPASLGQSAPDEAYAAFSNVPELTAGFNLLYQQKFEEARAKFTDWVAQHPADPFGPTAIAASYLFEEFYRQGVLTSEFYLDDKRFLHGIEGKPNPGRLKGFQKAITDARELAAARIRENSKDPEALFALTLAAGMESNSDTVLLKK